MPRHVSKEMQRIKRIGVTLYWMDNIVRHHDSPDCLPREAVAEVIAATPEERHIACWHVGLPDEYAEGLALTAEQTVFEFEDAGWLN